MSTILINFINILILLGLSIVIPTTIVGGMAIFRLHIKKEYQIYLYAFTTGLVLILGTVGFIGEAIAHTKEHFIEHINTLNVLKDSSHISLKIVDTLQVIAIVAGGALIGLFITIFGRYIFTKFNNKNGQDLHHEHSHHNHSEFFFNVSDVDNRNAKWLSIILLSGHRLIDGIVLGFMATTTKNEIANFNNWGMIIIFVVHLIPTSIVIYLIQLDISKNNYWKSFIKTFLFLLLMTPFTLIGGFLIDVLEKIWWIMPLLYSVSGSLMTFGGIMELIPEFIHARNASMKQWILITVWLGVSILLSIILLVIHSH